jgi:hypothetical protein
MSFNQHTNRNQKRKSHMEQTKMSRYFNKKSKNAEVVDNHKEKDNSETYYIILYCKLYWTVKHTKRQRVQTGLGVPCEALDLFTN